jgi:hypothetical protein
VTINFSRRTLLHELNVLSSVTDAANITSKYNPIANAQYSPIEEPGVARDSELRVVLVVVTGRRGFDVDLRGRRRRNRKPG